MVKFRKPKRGRRSVPQTLSAPTGGLNGRDGLGEMPKLDAFQMDNWFPYSTSVDTRGGSLDFETGLGSAVESLEVYTGAAGSKMLAFAGGGIYNVSAGGAVGGSLASGKTSNKTTSAMFSNAGSQFLLIYSGADQPLSYDGTTLAGLTITGLTGSQNNIHCGMAFKGRMFLGQKDQLGFYYLGIGAIQGAASFFDLQQQSFKGGALATMASFSQESEGAGPQDYAVFATTEGEYIMYGGTDPSNAATWTLVGRYVGPPPIGKKGWFKFRSDLYFITVEGILSFTQIREQGDDNEDNKYLTSKLGRNYTDNSVFQTTHGWAGILYPRGNMLLVNVPLTGSQAGKYAQFAMNTNTNAWGRFLGWNGLCWALFNGRAYFGTNTGKVILADEGITDNGVQVQATCRQAWNTFDDPFGMGAADKHFHFITFAMQADGLPSIGATINVNYEDDPPTTLSAFSPSGGTLWDVGDWDTSDWAGTPKTQNLVVSVGKLGYIGSLYVQAASVADKVRWFATRIVLEKTTAVLIQ